MKNIFNLNGKKGAIPSATIFIISIATFITVILLLVSAYRDFTLDNGGTIDSSYLAHYNSITGYKSNLDSTKINYANESTFSLYQAVGGLVAGGSTLGLTIGIGAIRTLAVLPNIVEGIINSAGTTLHVPSELIWLILFATTIYIASVLIQAYRGTLREV